MGGDLGQRRQAARVALDGDHALRARSQDRAREAARTRPDFDHGVNVTLGLPIVRTSPDHGTAFGIAGTGEAHPGAMIAAIRMAGEMAARRASA